MSDAADHAAVADEVAALKQQGNEELRAGNYAAALQSYSAALKLDPDSYIVLSNRSAAQLRLHKPAGALEDALRAIQLAPTWAKAYSRAAMAYKFLDRIDEGEEIAKKGLEIEPHNEALLSIMKEFAQARVVQQLRGPWHGQVAEEIGGYTQIFDFVDARSVKIIVLGTEVNAQYTLNIDAKPYPHLDMSVPVAVDSPVIRHIYRFAGPDELHMCSPYLRPAEERPVEFEGAGFVAMRRGLPVETVEETEARERIDRLTESEKVIEFIREAMTTVPEGGVQPLPTDSEGERSNKLAQGVRFQTAFFALAARYGQQVDQYVKELVIRVRSPPDDAPEIAAAVDAFRNKLQAAGLLDPADEQTSEAAAAAAIDAAGLNSTKPDLTFTESSPEKKPVPAAASKPATSKPVAAAKPVPPSAAPASSGSGETIALVLMGVAVCAAAVGLFLWSRPGSPTSHSHSR